MLNLFHYPKCLSINPKEVPPKRNFFLGLPIVPSILIVTLHRQIGSKHPISSHIHKLHIFTPGSVLEGKFRRPLVPVSTSAKNKVPPATKALPSTRELLGLVFTLFIVPRSTAGTATASTLIRKSLAFNQPRARVTRLVLHYLNSNQARCPRQRGAYLPTCGIVVMLSCPSYLWALFEIAISN